MLETLNEYMANHEIPKLQNAEQLIALIGDNKCQYYAACYFITQVMLLRLDEKMRCVLCHGTSNSGKSYIGDIMHRIFISYLMNEVRGQFDVKMTQLDAHVQLLVMNEANLHVLFQKKLIQDFKLLTEGRGRIVENKFCSAFKGFVGSYQLVTCQFLLCPLVEPLSSKSSWSRYEYLHDNRALMNRIRIVKFDKEYRELNHQFADKEWAQCLLYMAENFNDMQYPEQPNLFEVERLGEDDQLQSNSIFKPPEGALIAEANDWKKKFNASEERCKQYEMQIKLL